MIFRIEDVSETLMRGWQRPDGMGEPEVGENSLCFRGAFLFPIGTKMLTVPALCELQHLGYRLNILPRVGTVDAANTFSGGVFGAEGGPAMAEGAWDYSRLTFSPGEIKQQIFDFSIDPTPQQGGLVAGTYSVQGSFAGHAAAPLILHIQ
jgi:hypothetical protein